MVAVWLKHPEGSLGHSLAHKYVPQATIQQLIRWNDALDGSLIWNDAQQTNFLSNNTHSGKFVRVGMLSSGQTHGNKCQLSCSMKASRTSDQHFNMISQLCGTILLTQ
jgi:hypothetical protein